MGFEDADSEHTKVFLEKLKEAHPNKHLVIIWDNAPFHKRKTLHNIENITPIFLPSYSPQLNPVERFFEELRKSTANQIYENINLQEKDIESALMGYFNNLDKTKTLTGYDWILKQWIELS